MVQKSRRPCEQDPQVSELNTSVPISRLSADLADLRRSSSEKSLTVDELEKALKGRGSSMLLVLLALPFCVIPIPGVSIPFGIAVFLIGFRVALGQKPRCPE